MEQAHPKLVPLDREGSGTVITDTQRTKIREAFTANKLKIQSVSPEGKVEWKRVFEVFRNEVPWEVLKAVTTAYGTKVLTGGHKVYTSPTERVPAENLSLGDHVVAVVGGVLLYVPILKIEDIPPRRFMFDLTAEDWHNFVLHRSRVVVSNSPDKFYHFRPPEHSGRVGNYDRVFGQIWEDAELLCYLETSLDYFNMFPPSTFGVCSLDILVNTAATRGWKSVVLWGAIVHAMFAVAANWVADEFDYSIGGVSLSIDKSSKYESLKQNAEGQFDKGVEAKARTVKFIRGLQQPKFGMGIRSAFGPHVGRGVLSPRNFL